MNNQHLKELYESNEGDLKIKMKTKTINVISYILIKISPVFRDMIIEEKNGKKLNKKFLDLTDKNEYALDLVLRYIYYEYNSINEFEENKELLQDNICEIILLFDFFKLKKPNDLIEHIEEIDEIEPALLIVRFKKFKEYGDLFESIRTKYRDYIIDNFVDKIMNSICYDKLNYGEYRWCCKHEHKKINKNHESYKEGKLFACIYYELKKNYDKNKNNAFKNRCCSHREECEVRDDLGYDFINKLPKNDKEYILRKILQIEL
jgi:BTB/POZ domain.